MSSTTAADVDDHQPSNTDADELKRRMEESNVFIRKWEADDSVQWDESKNEVFQYLAAVDDVISVVEVGDVTVMDKANSMLQSAMAKLETNFRLLLVRNTAPLDVHRLAQMTGDDFKSFGEDNPDSSGFCHERAASLELIRSEAVHHLHEIAKRMIKADYVQECCLVYTRVRRDVLDELLETIGFELVSISDLWKMNWNHLNVKMKKWAQAVKIVVQVLLYGEKDLCAKVFDGSESLQGACFTEVSKGCVMKLMHFGEAVAIAKTPSEKRFEILNMYDALYNMMPQIEELFSDEPGKIVRLEVGDVLKDLGKAAIVALSESERRGQGVTFRKPAHRGQVQPVADSL